MNAHEERHRLMSEQRHRIDAEVDAMSDAQLEATHDSLEIIEEVIPGLSHGFIPMEAGFYSRRQLLAILTKEGMWHTWKVMQVAKGEMTREEVDDDPTRKTPTEAN